MWFKRKRKISDHQRILQEAHATAMEINCDMVAALLSQHPAFIRKDPANVIDVEFRVVKDPKELPEYVGRIPKSQS